MITIYDILTELQSFLHVDKKDLDFAKKSKINDSNNNEIKSLVNKWSTGVYDEDPDQLLNSLLDLLEKSESVDIIESLIDKQLTEDSAGVTELQKDITVKVNGKEINLKKGTMLRHKRIGWDTDFYVNNGVEIPADQIPDSYLSTFMI